MVTRFADGHIPAFQFTPRENASIHVRVRTWPHGRIKDTFHTLETAKGLLDIWKVNPVEFMMDEADIEEFQLAIEMAEDLGL